jgi:alpha-galactosidase
MRIGADVAPYWSNAIDRVGGRGRHGVSTRNAVVNTLTRSVLDGRWWLNDPDCLMVRDNRTRMDLEEVRTLATVIGLTDGMAVLSDRMDKLPAERRRMVAQVRELSGGRPEVLDLFEQARPELVVSRRDDGLDVDVLNMGDRPRRTVVDLRRPGLLGQLPTSLADDGELVEFWTGAVVPVRGGLADFGDVPAHGARVVRLRA